MNVLINLQVVGYLSTWRLILLTYGTWGHHPTANITIGQNHSYYRGVFGSTHHMMYIWMIMDDIAQPICLYTPNNKIPNYVGWLHTKKLVQFT
jgi:hypothetical protein